MINFKKASQPLVIIIFTKLQTAIVIIQEMKNLRTYYQNFNLWSIASSLIRDWNNLNSKTSIDFASPDLTPTKLVKGIRQHCFSKY